MYLLIVIVRDTWKAQTLAKLGILYRLTDVIKRQLFVEIVALLSKNKIFQGISSKISDLTEHGVPL